MKYFKDVNDNVYAYESDGSQDAYIKVGLVPIDNAEVVILTAPPPPTHRESRDSAVDNILVTVDKLVFNGNELSQSRMARAVLCLKATETIQWKLADNSVAKVTQKQLKKALLLANKAQSDLWVI